MSACRYVFSAVAALLFIMLPISGQGQVAPVKPIKGPPISIASQYNLLTNILNHATCDGVGARFSFSVTPKGNKPIKKLVLNYSVSDGAGVVAQGNTTLNTSVLITTNQGGQPIGPGTYTITITSGQQGFQPLTATLYIGYETIWDQKTVSYSETPNSYSLLAQSTQPAGQYAWALSENCGSPSSAWIMFTPVAPGLSGPGDNIMRFSLQNFASQTPGATEHYLQFEQAGTGVKMSWNPASGMGAPSAQLPVDPTIRIEFTSTETKVFANNTLEAILPLQSDEVIIRCQSNAQGDGFRNVISNMGCKPKVYAKLERKLLGVKYQAEYNKVFFYYDEEYEPDSDLSYKIFTTDDRITPVVDGANPGQVQPVIYGDNRYQLDVSTLASGAYILEVQNDKHEIFYLRFVK